LCFLSLQVLISILVSLVVLSDVLGETEVEII